MGGSTGCLYLILGRPPRSTLFPYLTLFRSRAAVGIAGDQNAHAGDRNITPYGDCRAAYRAGRIAWLAAHPRHPVFPARLAYQLAIAVNHLAGERVCLGVDDRKAASGATSRCGGADLVRLTREWSTLDGVRGVALLSGGNCVYRPACGAFR